MKIKDFCAYLAIGLRAMSTIDLNLRPSLADRSWHFDGMVGLMINRQ